MSDRFFARTEARTHIFYLRKHAEPASDIRLMGAGPNGELTEEMALPPKLVRMRLDYSFHSAQKKTGASIVTLRDLGAEIARGAHTHKECMAKKLLFFHTTDFKRFPNGLAVYPTAASLPERWVARKGDILLPRVGARCLHYAAKVYSGNPVLTDCVYRIRVESNWREAVWKALSSVEGIHWRQYAAHGVCARALSKDMLLDFPVPMLQSQPEEFLAASALGDMPQRFDDLA